MEKMIVKGQQKLSGEVTIGGAKNSTVALIPAAILADTPVKFDSVPDILDVHNLMLILKAMNVDSTYRRGELLVDPTKSRAFRFQAAQFEVCARHIILWGLCLESSAKQSLDFPAATISVRVRLISISKVSKRWGRMLKKKKIPFTLRRVQKDCTEQESF